MRVDENVIGPVLWRKGKTLEEYVEQMDEQQAAMARRLDEVTLAPDDVRFFERCGRPRYVVGMTEDWCGDSLMNLPIVVRIVKAVPQLELRIFVRSEAAALNRYYEGRDISNIPVFTFLDADFEEIGTWVERSQAGHSRIEEWVTEHSEAVELYSDPALTADERRRLFDERFGMFWTEMEGWYEEGLQQATIDEIRSLLSEAIVVHSA